MHLPVDSGPLVVYPNARASRAGRPRLAEVMDHETRRSRVDLLDHFGDDGRRATGTARAVIISPNGALSGG